IFRSTATVLVETSQSRVVSIDQIVANTSANREFFTTQAEFLKSRDVTARVVQDLKLVDHPLYDVEAKRSTVVDDLVEKAKGWMDALASWISPGKEQPAVIARE